MVSRVTHDKSAVRANVHARARSRARDVTKLAFPPKKKHQSTPVYTIDFSCYNSQHANMTCFNHFSLV